MYSRSLRFAAIPVLISLALLKMACTPFGEKRGTPLVIFAAVGDTPYSFAHEQALRKNIARLNGDPEIEFLVHIGDIKPGGRTPCREYHYRRIADILRTSKKPVFILPGDNEWNDCADPKAAWSLWRKHLFGLERSWKKPFRVERQRERPENFAFVRGGVLFLGINLVGGRVHNTVEWSRRHAQNAAWIRRLFRERGTGARSAVIFAHYGARFPRSVYRDFFGRLAEEARAFGKPVLFLHGDSHKWEYEEGFLAENITRVMIGFGAEPPQKVVLTDDPGMPFWFPGRTTPK